MIPKVINPMLAAQGADAPFDSEQHLFEIKWDGIRCLAFIDSGRVRLQSRHLTEITSQFPELADLKRLPSGTVLDGELIIFQDGRPSLRQVQQRALLQNRVRIERLGQLTPGTYVVFDLLYLEGRALLDAPLSHRRQALARLIDQYAPSGVLVSEGVAEHGCKLFAQVALLRLEGIMAKRLDSPYLPSKRCRHWLKIKPRPSVEVLLATTAMAHHL
jgi:ATP-dependent DNA ligase